MKQTVLSEELDWLAKFTARSLKLCFSYTDMKTAHKLRVYFMMRLSEELKDKEQKEDERA